MEDAHPPREATSMESAESVPARRFHTIDGMVLVAALAAWLSMMPGYFVSVPRAVREAYGMGLQLAGLAPWTTPGTRQVAWLYLHAAAHNVVAPGPFLLGYLVPAVLILGLRQPQSSWRGLIRQSGFGSCLLLGLYPLVRLEVWWLGGAGSAYAADAAMASVLLWAVLGWRPWQAEPTWLDRLGRGVASCWIIVLSLWAADHVLCGCGV
jgi:hypothetical protein